MNKSTILALAVALTTGAGTALAQSDPGSAPGGPPSGPTAPSAPGPMPRDSGSSMGSGTMNPPMTTAPEPSTTASPSMATNPPAAAMPNTGPTTGAPAGGPGEARARSLIERDGYKNVGPLTRGPDGTWQGTAMRGSTSVQVMVDARGNVVTQ
jgi:hypothetical protein